MSLTLRYPPNFAPHRPETLRLPRCYDDEDHTEELALQMDSLIPTQNHASVRVFAGRLASTAAGPQSCSYIPVVCKLSYTSQGMGSLAWEALMYHNLYDLQGTVVPRSYGFFEEQGYASCLVLAYAGQPLNNRFEDLDNELKEQIMDAFNQIHECSVEHNDVVERNVLVNDRGHVSVIGFASATGIACQRHLLIPPVGGLGPDETEFGCEELYDLGCEMKMWRPAIVVVYGRPCPVSGLNDPQELIAHRPQYWSQERAEEEVHTVLLRYIQRWFPHIFAMIPQDGQRHWPKFNARDGDHELDLLAHNMSKMFYVNTDNHDSLSLDMLADSFGKSVKLQC